MAQRHLRIKRVPAAICSKQNHWETGPTATEEESPATSSTGFVLPNGAKRSPDASWTPKEEIRQLGAGVEGYWHLCPAFAIELRSHSDRLPVLRAKMQEYIANGASLAWLIDPQTRAVEVYRPSRQPESLAEIDSRSGEGPVQGFVLDLRPVWNPLAG